MKFIDERKEIIYHHFKKMIKFLILTFPIMLTEITFGCARFDQLAEVTFPNFDGANFEKLHSISRGHFKYSGTKYY